ncbi:hypothetical protein RF55_12989 [Lasius niger]|uniref:Uncharacterized protein n=1 Tax=Lasius niger TaxID=67767 RepID=A0A0J7KBL2_LASNI|nr:hypothetical protein RF55_12989 [Lasius niger]
MVGFHHNPAVDFVLVTVAKTKKNSCRDVDGGQVYLFAPDQISGYFCLSSGDDNGVAGPDKRCSARSLSRGLSCVEQGPQLTRKEWEKEISMKELDELPTLDEILSFLEKRCLMLEMTERGKAKSETSSSTASKKTEKIIVMATITTKCAHCEGSHSIFKCEKFLKLLPCDRYTETKRLKLCTNCLKENHISRDCTLSSCRKCDLKHNTLLHRSQSQNVEVEKKNSEKKAAAVHYSQSQAIEENATSHEEEANDHCKVTTHCLPKQVTRVILSTAQVYVCDINGILHKCRALLDPGSQINMITEEFADKLRISQKRIKRPISGVTQARITINKSLKIQMTSTTSNFKIELECLVPPVITEYIPQVTLNRSELAIPGHIDFADPDFGTPGPIDLLLGAGPFWKLLRLSEVISRKNGPMLQNTYVGWIVGDEYVTRVNQTEEVEVIRSKTKEEEFCEEQFLRTHKRDAQGRFQVELPKRTEIILGNSFDGALKRLLSLEK